jgi:HD-GYP domain-containing protein (c-di-GMP phosphodiesterase class II)
MIMNSFVVLGKALEMRDPYTFSHTRNVALIAVQIAKALGWDEDRILSIRLASEIHDLGKISIPLDILNKPGKLGELEYQLIKRHVENCCNLIKDIDFPFSLSEIVYQHHERLDGSGYPRGLKSGQINEEARLLAICDVLESMTGHRPYRAALGIDKALEELKSGRGIKYDAKITDIAIDIIKKNKGKVFWPLS